jgi:ribosomal protein S18 acetylase RimI-like enzyme
MALALAEKFCRRLRLSLLGKATFLETYAGNTEAADLLAFVEAEHSAERFRLWLESDFAKIWIAETIPGHSAIGYAVALVPSDGLGVEIKRLYVLHRFRQNGLGHRLMSEILATARHDGISKVFLKVEKANQSAVDFYSRNGFRVVGKESFPVGARDHEALVMRLALATPAEDASRLTAFADTCISARPTHK